MWNIISILILIIEAALLFGFIRCTAADYDYYIYDEMLITSAEELLNSLGYSVTEK